MPVRWSWKPRRMGSEVWAWTKRGVAVRAAVAARPWSTVRRVVVMVFWSPCCWAEHVVTGAESL